MLQGLYFGAVLNYCSPIDEHLTKCIYVGKENETRAIVLFENAERVARVDFKQLKWVRKTEDTSRDMKQYLANISN